jgi:hypothetical protein
MKTARPVLRSLLLGCLLFGVGAAVDVPLLPGPWSGSFAGDAHAIPGRPATPRSAAGVARRTTRRRVRRSTIYVATLPRHCARVVVDGVSLHRCGGSYYRRAGSQYVVVYVD